MVQRLTEQLSQIKNRCIEGNSLEAQASREVVYHLQQKGFAQECIPPTRNIIYFAELYNTALDLLKSKNAPRGDKP